MPGSQCIFSSPDTNPSFSGFFPPWEIIFMLPVEWGPCSVTSTSGTTHGKVKYGGRIIEAGADTKDCSRFSSTPLWKKSNLVFNNFSSRARVQQYSAIGLVHAKA